MRWRSLVIVFSVIAMLEMILHATGSDRVNRGDGKAQSRLIYKPYEPPDDIGGPEITGGSGGR